MICLAFAKSYGHKSLQNQLRRIHDFASITLLHPGLSQWVSKTLCEEVLLQNTISAHLHSNMSSGVSPVHSHSSQSPGLINEVNILEVCRVLGVYEALFLPKNIGKSSCLLLADGANGAVFVEDLILQFVKLIKMKYVSACRNECEKKHLPKHWAKSKKETNSGSRAPTLVNTHFKP